MTTELSPSQHAILAHAIHNTAGEVSWFPDNIKGGARNKVLDAMLNRELVINDGTTWLVATGGYEAMGVQRPQPTPPAAPEANAMNNAAPSKPRTRDNTKQATVIAMLKGDGATIAQVCAATGWQAHTVRGTFAGAFKKKLGLNVTSTKADGAERVYRITASEAAA